MPGNSTTTKLSEDNIVSVEMLLGLDLGTTSCKAALYTSQGDLFAESRSEYALEKFPGGKLEQDPDTWWAAVRKTILDITALHPAECRSLRALSISSQGISFVPVDAKGHPLGNAISWLDRRAVVQTEAILKRCPPEKLYRITGKRISAGSVLGKLLWLREENSSIYRKAAKFLMAHDYIIHLLTGSYVTDHTMAGGTVLYDVTDAVWSSYLLELFEIPKDKLPELQWAGTTVGKIKADVARSLGINKNTDVVVGGQDQKCASFGAGIHVGGATVSLGTASAVSCLSDSPALDKDMRLPIFSYLFPGFWDMEGVLSTSGACLQWLKDTFYPEKNYRQLDEMADRSNIGAGDLCFYPFLAGAYTPHYKKSVRGIFNGINLFTSAGDMVRSVLEGVAFQIREIVETQESTGERIDELLLFGGGATSQIWREIIGDVTRKIIVQIPTAETAALGAAMLAGIGAEIFPDPGTASDAMVKKGYRRQPNESNHEKYNEIYNKYRLQEEIIMSPFRD